MLKEYPFLTAETDPDYEKNFNKGYKNVKEIFNGETFKYPNIWIFGLYVAFIFSILYASVL